MRGRGRKGQAVRLRDGDQAALKMEDRYVDALEYISSHATTGSLTGRILANSHLLIATALDHNLRPKRIAAISG